jgi:acyl carrier protein
MMDQDLDAVTVDRIAVIRDIVADTFSVEPGQVEAAESFVTDLEADSLLAVELLTHLEKRFGVTIRDLDVPLLMLDLRSAYRVVAESAGW